MSVVIETHDLSKTYEGSMFSGQHVHALKDLNLSVNSGEIFGYLGPNGSGKTTTIKLLLTLIFPTAGSIRILGRDDIQSAEVRKKIGYVPEGAYYPDFLKGEEVLRFYGQLYGLRGRDLTGRIERALETVGMTHARKRLIRGYSKGMRQRIGLAQALLSDPELLILDEPTTGLDPLARKEIRDILAGLRDQGKTLLISSHELLEVELISDRIAILYNGEMQTCGTLDDLLTDRDVTILVEAAPADVVARLKERGLTVEDTVQHRLLLRVPNSMGVYDALDVCRQQNLNVVNVTPKRETVEELFVRVVGSARQRELAAAG